MSSVDLTPTWVNAIEICIIGLEAGSPKGQAMARAELRDMATKLDALNGFKRRGVSHWDEQPGHPVSDWQAECAADETRLGYLDWVDARIDMGDES